MIGIITIILFPFIPVILAQMDTLVQKYSQYETSYFKKVAKFLVKIKVFKTQEIADKFFNKDGLGWTLAYIDGVKDFSKPYKNKIRWKILWFYMNKPAQLVDAWHWLKGLLIVIICTAFAINLPIPFIIVNVIITKVIYFFILNLLWFVFFETTYNNK